MKSTSIRCLALLALFALAAVPALAAEPAADPSPETLFAPQAAQCTAPAAEDFLDLGKGGPPGPVGGGVCGDTVCASDQYCCNESCSICAPFDGACTQQVCFPDGPIGI